MTKLCQKRGDSDAGMPMISTGDVWIKIVKIQVNVSMRENHLRDNAVKSGYVHCKSKNFGRAKYHCYHSKIEGKNGHTVQKCHKKCNLIGKGCRILCKSSLLGQSKTYDLQWLPRLI